MIRAVGLRYEINGVDVLRGVDLTVGSGEVVAVVGPHAAGKSLLLRVLATLAAPHGGELEVDGIDCVRSPERVRHRIGFVPDRATLRADGTVEEELRFECELSRVEPAVFEGTVELTELAPLLPCPIHVLTDAQRRRVELARALLRDPELLLIDEPTAGLEPRARLELLDLLRELRGLGKTVIVATQHTEELEGLCSSLVVLDRGRLRASGTFDEVVRELGRTAGARSAWRRVKLTVLGSMNRVREVLAEHELELVPVRGTLERSTFWLLHPGAERETSDACGRLIRAGVPVAACEPEASPLGLHLAADHWRTDS